MLINIDVARTEAWSMGLFGLSLEWKQKIPFQSDYNGKDDMVFISVLVLAHFIFILFKEI